MRKFPFHSGKFLTNFSCFAHAFAPADEVYHPSTHHHLRPRPACVMPRLALGSHPPMPHTHHNRHRPVSRRGRPSQSCHVTHPWPHPPLGSDWCWLAVGAETFALRGSFSRVVPQISKIFPRSAATQISNQICRNPGYPMVGRRVASGRRAPRAGGDFTFT